jgi:hypothetical protein
VYVHFQVIQNWNTLLANSELSGVWELSGSSLGALWELVAVAGIESKVIVNWSHNYQIVKGSSDKYNLNKDYVKVLHKRFGASIGTIVTGFTMATITSTSG